MKKLLIIIIGFFLFNPWSQAQAISNNSEATSSMVNQKETKAGETLENKEQGKNIVQNRERQMRQYYQILQVRLQAAVMRMNKLGERIANRLIKMKTQGINTTSLEGQLASTQETLTAVEANIDLLDTTMEELFLTSEKTTVFTQAKTLLRKIKDDLKTIQQQYITIVTEIKKTLPSVTSPTTPATKSATITNTPTNND